MQFIGVIATVSILFLFFIIVINGIYKYDKVNFEEKKFTDVINELDIYIAIIYDTEIKFEYLNKALLSEEKDKLFEKSAETLFELIENNRYLDKELDRYLKGIRNKFVATRALDTWENYIQKIEHMKGENV